MNAADMEAWLAERPPAVREKVRAYPGDAIYILATTGQQAWIYSYTEAPDGSCETCTITTFNNGFGAFVHVFGIRFTDLRVIS